jgi:hypothetical protein
MRHRRSPRPRRRQICAFLPPPKMERYLTVRGAGPRGLRVRHGRGVTAPSLRSFFAHSFELKPQVAGFLVFLFPPPALGRLPHSITINLLSLNAEETGFLKNMPVRSTEIAEARERKRSGSAAEVSHIAKTLPLDPSPFELHRMGVLRRFCGLRLLSTRRRKAGRVSRLLMT